MDVKFLDRISGTRRRLFQFTAIDDCTWLRVPKIFDAGNQRAAIQFIDEVLRRLPFRVHDVQADYGAEFQSQFHWHLESQDVRPCYIRPRTARLNGRVERSHPVDDQEFYQLLDQEGISVDIHLFDEKLREWEDYYNYHQPHGALSGQVTWVCGPCRPNGDASPVPASWNQITSCSGGLMTFARPPEHLPGILATLTVATWNCRSRRKPPRS